MISIARSFSKTLDRANTNTRMQCEYERWIRLPIGPQRSRKLCMHGTFFGCGLESIEVSGSQNLFQALSIPRFRNGALRCAICATSVTPDPSFPYGAFRHARL